MELVKILMISEIVVSSLLVLSIVMQPKEDDAGTLFGGGFGDEVKRTKRGFELFLHNMTIVLAVLWAAIAVSVMIVNK